MAPENKVLEFSTKQQIHDQAAAWVIRLEQGEITLLEKEKLRQWLQQSEYHREVLLDTIKVWDRMEVLSCLSDLMPLGHLPTARNTRFRFAIPVTALAIICLSVYIFFAVDPRTDPSTQQEANVSTIHGQTYETSVGGYREIDLPDGSIVKLNTASRIEVNFTRNRRAVAVLEGEVFFAVTRNEKKPFVVTADKTLIEVLGTSCAVYKQASQTEVIVTEGQVQVKRLDTAEEKDITTTRKVSLRAGQLVRISRQGTETIKQINPGEIARKLLWQQKMLAFEGDTLQQVIDEFSRYTTLKIRIADTETASIRVGGYFRSDDIAGLMTSLQENFEISVEQTAVGHFTLQKRRQ